MNRCSWCLGDPLYIDYHDREWGIPVHADRKLFEFLILEGAQAGLSWFTVLKKRSAYRDAFDGFDFNKIVNYKESRLTALLNNPGIIRNNLKIRVLLKMPARLLMCVKSLVVSINISGSLLKAERFKIHGPISKRYRLPADNLMRCQRT